MAATRPDQDPMVIQCLVEGRPASDIFIIDCPRCTHSSYYSQGFTSGCTNCGFELGPYSDDAYSLQDYWDFDRPEYPCDEVKDGDQ